MPLTKLSVRLLNNSRHNINYSKRGFQEVCKKPWKPPKLVKLAVLGCATPVGRITSLLLKQNPYIKELRLHDADDICCNMAADLSFIDTNVKVMGFAGPDLLKPAITVGHCNTSTILTLSLNIFG